MRGPQFGDASALETFIPGVIVQTQYEFTNPSTNRKNRRTFPLFDKKETAAELAYRLADEGVVLVFCAQTNWAESVAKALREAIELREVSQQPIPPFFNPKMLTRSLIVAREWLGKEHLVTQALERGIALHHGRIPERVREAIEKDLRANRYRVVIATNTLAQGVNLPVRTVIIHSCWRAQDAGTRERISVRDYWNIAGRAGRAGMETEGLIIHLTLNLGFYHLSSFRCSDLGCWVYYENTLPSPPRSEH